MFEIDTPEGLYRQTMYSTDDPDPIQKSRFDLQVDEIEPTATILTIRNRRRSGTEGSYFVTISNLLQWAAKEGKK
jgi:hypothetical protein